ncbi:hypothetical protein [Motiliproteus sediminis]|uniref:hypothetical protein n=1 Tax=Motiliproteus sediminis TaxID=1468178 RepID=UPI001AEFAF6C|nr:hypothetical protein [Motiliproteus sediminis]
MSGKLSSQECDRLLVGLQQLSATAFPKRCANCGAIYASPEEFVQHTDTPVTGRSVKAVDDEEEGRFLELYRNCRCGSTLMDLFSDRRMDQPQSNVSRACFERLLRQLQAHGMGKADAREQLLQLMRGEPAADIERLGIRVHP